MFCYHQNTKPEIVTFWANNLPLFDDDKTYKLFKRNLGKSLVKTPPHVMLAIKYKISISYMIKALYKSMIKQISLNTHKYTYKFSRRTTK